MKYYGAVGYLVTREVRPGVWVEDKIVERNYYGDVLRNSRRWDNSSDQQNDNLRLNNQFSILADPYALQHFNQIRYLTFMGIKWKVTEITIDGRRLICTIGEEYNGDPEED